MKEKIGGSAGLFALRKETIMIDIISKTKEEIRIAICEDNRQHLLHHKEVLSAAARKRIPRFYSIHPERSFWPEWMQEMNLMYFF